MPISDRSAAAGPKRYVKKDSAQTSYNSSSKFPVGREREFSTLLECPVCFSLPECEIYNCEQGHSICGDCRKQLSKCALCARPYTSSRNFVVESIITYWMKYGVSLNDHFTSNSMLLDCVHKTSGCKNRIIFSQMDEHISACQFRAIKCSVESSDKCMPTPLLKLSEYFEHLKQHHKIKGMMEPTGVFTKVDRLFRDFNINVAWPPFYLQYDGKVFLRGAAIRNRNVSWWIQLIGPENEADKYQAVIALQSPNRKCMKMTWTIPVNSVRRTPHEIEQSKGSASLSTKRILPFCLKDEDFGDRVATYAWTFQIILSRLE